jgi:hypothetical protein
MHMRVRICISYRYGRQKAAELIGRPTICFAACGYWQGQTRAEIKWEGPMDAAALRKRLNQSLFDEIDEVQFPSVTMMNRAEAALGTRDDLADYIEVLVKKVEATRFPSISMLNRLDGLLDQLEQVEQREQLETAQSNGARER